MMKEIIFLALWIKTILKIMILWSAFKLWKKRRKEHTVNKSINIKKSLKGFLHKINYALEWVSTLISTICLLPLLIIYVLFKHINAKFIIIINNTMKNKQNKQKKQ